MKKAFLFLALISSTSLFASQAKMGETLTSVDEVSSPSNFEVKEINKDNDFFSDYSNTNISKKSVKGDCTFHVKGEYEGHTYDLEITIEDVSLVKCLAIKAAVFAGLKKH